MTAEEYAPKNIHVIDELLQGRQPEDGPLTLALDVTLDKLHSKEIDDFVARNQDAIDQGLCKMILAFSDKIQQFAGKDAELDNLNALQIDEIIKYARKLANT